MVDIGRREDRMLDLIHDLYRTRRKTITTCLDFKESNPDLAVVMDWILTVALEATDKELAR